MTNKWIYGGLPKFEENIDTLELKNCVSLGSCFARNIVKWLNYNNFSQTPILYDILYNPYSIYFEISRLFNEIVVEDYYLKILFNNELVYVDPFRTWISGKSIEDITLKNNILTNDYYKLVKQSSCIIITYGLSEVWFSRKNSKVVINNLPYKTNILNRNEYNLRLLTLEETISIIEKTIIEIRRNLGANVPIVFSLSPIPLKYTSTKYDIRTANNISKATLRLALFHIVQKQYSNVHYFPAYEIVQALNEQSDIWQLDGRHIKSSIINEVCKMFLIFSNNQDKINKVKGSFFVPKVDNEGLIIGECHE